MSRLMLVALLACSASPPTPQEDLVDACARWQMAVHCLHCDSSASGKHGTGVDGGECVLAECALEWRRRCETGEAR